MLFSWLLTTFTRKTRPVHVAVTFSSIDLSQIYRRFEFTVKKVNLSLNKCFAAGLKPIALRRDMEDILHPTAHTANFSDLVGKKDISKRPLSRALDMFKCLDFTNISLEKILSSRHVLIFGDPFLILGFQSSKPVNQLC